MLTWLRLGCGGSNLLLVACAVGQGGEDVLQRALHEALGLLVHLQLGQCLWLLWRCILLLHLLQRPLSQSR